MSFAPRTLFAQVLLVLVAGIGFAVAAGVYINAGAREEAVRAVGAVAAVQRIVNVTRLVEEMPQDWSERLVRGASDPAFAIVLSRTAEQPKSGSAAGLEAAGVIRGLLADALPGRTIFVTLDTAATAGWEAGPDGNRLPGMRGPGFGGAGFGGPGGMHGWGMGPGGGHYVPGYMRHAGQSWRNLSASVGLKDGRSLSFSAALADSGPAASWRTMLALALVSMMIAALAAWAARRVTSPLAQLADAARSLGRNVDASPLALSGTREMQQAAQAFNEMQTRLKKLVENRTLMLAAISHDLRTQLTLARLRAEALPDNADRQKLEASLRRMEEMLTATLAFAREDALREAPKSVDLGALVTSIVDDMSDAGLAVSLNEPVGETIATVRPVALRRAVTNLIDNAIKYGGVARAGVAASGTDVTVVIDDDGPGIPTARLADVVEPFARLDEARHAETGGIGLGLTIARSVAEAHGGRLRLENREGGGLRATLTVPVGAARPAI